MSPPVGSADSQYGRLLREIEASGQTWQKNSRNSEARERIRKPERKKDAGNRYVYLVKTKTHNGTKRMFIEN